METFLFSVHGLNSFVSFDFGPSFTFFSFVYVVSKDDEVSPLQLHLLNQSSRKIKDTVSKLATEHKELHGGISKIGKAVDRVSHNMLYERRKLGLFKGLAGTTCVLFKLKYFLSF